MTQQRRWKGRVVAGGAALLMAASLAACNGGGEDGGSAQSGGSSDASGVILNVAGQSDNLTQVFNPYLPVTAYTVSSNNTWIYEPLVQVNVVKVGDDKPWLAEKWEWSDNNTKITFHLRQGVKWTDGQPFTADDVVFTYKMLEKFPALNTTGVAFKTVTAPDQSTVEFTFDSSYEPYFFLLVNVPIVPQHIWSKVSDPTQYQDSNPVGTGPFMLASFSPQSYLLKKNPHYWQAGKPEIGGLRFIAYKDNQAQTNALVQGEVDWAGTFIANVDETYLSRSKDNHYWAPDVGMDGLIPNLEKWPLSELSVRQAVSLAVDRGQIAASRNSHPATNQIGLPMPAFQDQVAPEYKDLNFTYDPAKAKQVLEADGFVMGSDGYYAKDGKEIDFKITFPSAYTDITAPAQVIVDNLKKVGIKAEIDGVAVSDINNITATGDFQATIGYPISAPPNAYLYYDYLMNPKYYVPTGTIDPTWQNMERFQSADARKLFDDYLTATTDEQRTQIMNGLEKVWVDNLPMITMFYWGYYGDWSTAKVTGFPDEKDPYFQPNPNPVTAINLVPVAS